MEIHEIIKDSIRTKEALLHQPELLQNIQKAADACIKCFRNKGKVLFCGNGGSAADAQHLSAELSGRYFKDRPPLFSEALHVNTSYLTAVANDYDFDTVFSRMLQAMGDRGDVLVALSTSGNSPNVVQACQKAAEMGITTIALTGKTGGRLASIADILINIPSDSTPRIQESHIMIGHILCEKIEQSLFPDA